MCSSDLRDLKGTIKGVLRAPLSDDQVLAEIWASHGEGAAGADALDYWLVLADQFDLSRAKRFDSLARAESEVQFGVGFLIEVREPFLDERGVSRPSGCYFSGRMD